MKICTIIVTYNRKKELLRCINAVLNQTVKVNTIIVVDNASSDNTFEYLREKNILNENSKVNLNTYLFDDLIQIIYLRLNSNQGGAGGFYNGLKYAHEMNQFDAYWLMDDDGFPSDNCLQSQINFLKDIDYVMPVSIDINNFHNLSWATRLKNGKKTISLQKLKEEWGKQLPFVFPFNGSLLSNKLVNEVGYINPKLFIWGDDYEHYFRCKKKGYNPITILDAEFYHPVNKAPTIPILFGLINVPYTDSDLRFVCLIRNWSYINKKNHNYMALLKSFAAYTWLFLFNKKFNLSKYKLFLYSYFDGLRNNFERHKQYLK